MSVYRRPEEFQAVLERTLQRARHGPAERALCGAGLKVGFEYSEPDLALLLDGSTGELRFSFGPPGAAEVGGAHVSFRSSGDVGHAFWSGALNVPAALALGRVRARGPVSRALALLPVMPELNALYREACGPREEGAAPAAPPPATPAPVAARNGFATVRAGLDHASFPMRLYHKAKKLGVWDPCDLDFSADRADWLALRDGERAVLAALTALFAGGEEGVTLDLLPLVACVAREGRVEEELYLTTFLWEEAKHTEFFDRVLREIFALEGDLGAVQGPCYRRVFEEELPNALAVLWRDPSPAAQVRAGATYNMIVEGVLAETGYHAYREMLAARGLLPGLRAGIDLLQRDEARHIAYGVHFLSRHVRADPALWEVARERMEELLPIAVGIIPETLARFDPADTLGLDLDRTLEFALGQFRKRLARIERARDGGIEEAEEDAAG